MTPNDEQLRKLALEKPQSPYRVEAEHHGCEQCGLGSMWKVVFRPNETATGTIYGDKDEAEEMAADLNGAYALGWDDRNSDLLHCLEIVERALEIAAVESVLDIVYEHGGTGFQLEVKKEWLSQAERELEGK